MLLRRMGTKERIWQYYMECENVFTPEYWSRLPRSLNTNQECSVIPRIYPSRNYGNADIINFIDAGYFKTENTTILE